MPTGISIQASTIISVLGAVASWAGYLLNRASALETARPELVLTDWSYDHAGSGEGRVAVVDVGQMGQVECRGPWGATWGPQPPRREIGTIRIKGIKNVGRGVALHGIMSIDWPPENRPHMIMSGQTFSVIAPGETLPVDIEISIWWGNVEGGFGPGQMAGGLFHLMAWDTRGMRYTTKYRLTAFNPHTHAVAGLHEVAPGLGAHRWVERESVWRLKSKGWFTSNCFKIKRKGQFLWATIGKFFGGVQNEMGSGPPHE